MTHRSSGNVGRLTISGLAEDLYGLSVIRSLLSFRVSSPMSSRNPIVGSIATGLERVFVHFIAFFAILVQASDGRCDLILGNMAQRVNDSGIVSGFDSTNRYSIGFTVGSTPISLTSVEMRLRANTSPGLATLELRSNDGGNPSASALAFFTSQTVGTGFSTIQFAPVNSMQLTASTKYWLTIGTSMVSPNGLVLGANDPSIAPTGPFATFDGLRFGPSNDQSQDVTGFFGTPSFAINGTVTAVPEPSSMLQLALGCGIYSWYRRRAKRSRLVGS